MPHQENNHANAGRAANPNRVLTPQNATLDERETESRSIHKRTRQRYQDILAAFNRADLTEHDKLAELERILELMEHDWDHLLELNAPDEDQDECERDGPVMESLNEREEQVGSWLEEIRSLRRRTEKSLGLPPSR
jgi:hypothetical protein